MSHLSGNPTDIEDRVLKGRVACQEGRYEEAIRILDPLARANSIGALRWISVAFRESGSPKAAAGVAMHALQLRPNEPDLLIELGLSQIKLMMLEEARSSFEKALALSETAEAANHLGRVLFMLGRPEEAANAYRKAIAHGVSHPETHVGLARCLLATDEVTAASEEAAKALEVDPGLCSAHILQAQIQIKAGRALEARTHAEDAIHFGPTDPLAHAILGQALQSLGQGQEAEAAFRRSLEIEPRQGFGYLGLIYGRKVRESDREFEAQMLALTNDPSLPRSDHQYLHYALGRLYESLGDSEKAMRQYDQANRIARFIKFRDRPFDRDTYVANRNRAISFFTKDRFRDLEGKGSPSETPIFIVGMMRSGTTLLEQLLSSHPKVAGAGEQGFWLRNGPRCFDPATKNLNHEQLLGLADDYLTVLEGFGPEADRVTDKMPGNDLVLGFIHAAFPNARIIHMWRNPPDTCFSTYVTPNEAVFDFAHDKEAIAFAYREHEKLMDHWRKVLPADRLIDVVYEELVGSLEPVARRVVDFCGLEWDERCLTPEANPSSVVTPSAWQVRQPIYRTSVQRWKAFEPWIPEFAELDA